MTFLSLLSYYFVYIVSMDLLIWNCRGSLKPTFCNNVFDLVRTQFPAIMILIKTKACGDRAKGIIDGLPFDGAIFANTIGLSGALWLLWDSSQVAVVKLLSMEQEIHAMVTPNHQDGLWLFSTVYTSPWFAERCLFWENLILVSGLHSLPWVVASDFNKVLIGEDKYGGWPVNISQALHFQECLDTCCLIDIGFFGPRYTWSNQRL